MATISLCTRCGYVNEWKRQNCFVCASPLPPSFSRHDLRPGMRIDLERLDPNLTARRLGKGKVFVTPDNMVGIVRRRLVTSVGFLRRPVLRHNTDHWVSPRHPDAYAIGVFIMDTIGLVAEGVRAVEWLVRFAAEAVGRAAGGSYVIEAVFERGPSLFWKVPGRRPVHETVAEVVQAMSIGDTEFVPEGWERVTVD